MLSLKTQVTFNGQVSHTSSVFLFIYDVYKDWKNKLGLVGKYILRYKVVSDRKDEYNRIMNIYL